jgi:hypothetical protein
MSSCVEGDSEGDSEEGGSEEGGRRSLSRGLVGPRPRLFAGTPRNTPRSGGPCCPAYYPLERRSPGRALDIGPAPDEPRSAAGRDSGKSSCRPASNESGVVKRGGGGVVEARPEHDYFGDLVGDGPLEAEARSRF